jgi:ATP-dependent RNA helicase DeaD
VLNRNGFDAELLNGDLPQKERERVMAKVKRGEVALMVATDIAARGIDISDLGYVINYSLPEDPAVYLHRVGRTGRIGKKGVAINLVSGRELNTLSALENRYGIVFEKRAMPTPEQAISLWTERHVREIREGASGTVYDGLLPLAGQIRQHPDADDLIAFLLKYFFAHHRMDRIQAAHLAEAVAPSGGRPKEARSSAGAREREKPSRERPKRKRATAGEGVKSKTAIPLGSVRLWLNLGASDGFDQAGLKAALEGLQAPVASISRVDLRPTYSYLIVTEDSAPAFEALVGKSVGNKSLKLERAKRR